MDYEVVVVGGGIGGLTVAALLATRGMDVCVFERQPEVGGCAANFMKFGLEFEQSDGLYSSWEPGAIHDRIFSELPVEAPEVKLLDPTYAVRLPDHSQIIVGADEERLQAQLRLVFPECAEEAVEFYRAINHIGSEFQRQLLSNPDLLWSSQIENRIAAAGLSEPLDNKLDGVSVRFRRFVDAQLQILTQGAGQNVSFLQAALFLSQTQGRMFGIKSGAASLAARLAESITASGGRVRVDAPVLRLAYDSAGQAIGIDLLSGEQVTASKAIVSNLTLWDTYGKLVGLSRTPASVRATLKTLRGWGAYLLFLSLDEDALETLPARRVLTLADWQTASGFDPQDNQLFFNAASANSGSPDGKLPVTVHAFTEAEDWFSFHTDAAEIETKDQMTLEACWARLHTALPELGSSIEVIESMTPHDYYETTRRKLGMVGNVSPSAAPRTDTGAPFLTALPNLFVVGDTAFWGGLAGVSHLSFALANHISGKKT